jgi:Ca2+-binding EF-hand superfamily protein
MMSEKDKGNGEAKSGEPPKEEPFLKLLNRFRTTILGKADKNNRINRLADNTQKRGATADLKAVYQKLYDTVNSKNTNKRPGLNLIELKVAVYKNFPGFHLDEIKRIFSYLDQDGDGRVSMDEFLNGLRGSLSPYRQGLVDFVFLLLDSNGSGFIEQKELAAYFDKTTSPGILSGRNISPDLKAKEFIKMSGTEAKGTISLQQLTEFYLDRSLYIDDDVMFKYELLDDWLFEEELADLYVAHIAPNYTPDDMVVQPVPPKKMLKNMSKKSFSTGAGASGGGGGGSSGTSDLDRKASLPAVATVALSANQSSSSSSGGNDTAAQSVPTGTMAPTSASAPALGQITPSGKGAAAVQAQAQATQAMSNQFAVNQQAMMANQAIMLHHGGYYDVNEVMPGKSSTPVPPSSAERRSIVGKSPRVGNAMIGSKQQQQQQMMHQQQYQQRGWIQTDADFNAAVEERKRAYQGIYQELYTDVTLRYEIGSIDESPYEDFDGLSRNPSMKVGLQASPSRKDIQIEKVMTDFAQQDAARS